jgi:Glycosyl hydrolases family 25.
MQIQGQLVADGSLWNDHINVQELIDGGVVSFIIGLYQENVNGKIVLNTNCRRICDQLAASNLIMQAYYYVYPEIDPYKQADWFISTMQQYPLKFAWADMESMKTPMTGIARSLSYQKFIERLHQYFPASGVYTGQW